MELNEPRTLDLDILLIDEIIMKTNHCNTPSENAS